MASGVKHNLLPCLILIFVSDLPNILARKHNLILQRDERTVITMSEFGLQRNGSLSLTVSHFTVSHAWPDLTKMSASTFGFALLVSNDSSESRELVDSDSGGKCILDTAWEHPIFHSTDGIAMVFFRMEIANKQLLVQRRGYSVRNLVISGQSSHGMMDGTANTNGIKQETDVSGHTRAVPLQTKIPMTVSDGGIQEYGFSFTVSVTSEMEEGTYSLRFVNCLNNNSKKFPINMEIELIEMNGDNYLSVPSMHLLTVYSVLCPVYLLLAMVWMAVLYRSRSCVNMTHHLMLAVMFLQSLSCLFCAVDYHFININGVPVQAWSVLYYMVYMLCQTVLFITIFVIGSGRGIFRNGLSCKKLFIIFILLLIVKIIAWVITVNGEEGDSHYDLWKEIYILVDLTCGGIVLVPPVRSIRSFKKILNTCDNTEHSLAAELKSHYKHFYIMLVCFIYATRIIVYLLKMTVPYNYAWVDELFTELVTILLFIGTGYKFQPTTMLNQPYIQIPTEEGTVRHI